MKSIRSVAIVVSVCALISCAAAPPDIYEVQANNREKLTSLSVGMSREQALEKMGTETIRALNGPVITNPYRTEMYRSQGRTIEMLLYYTDTKKADRAITDDELTPIVVIDGRVDGWGWSYWQDVVEKYEIRVR